jgi:hypothetical protein
MSSDQLLADTDIEDALSEAYVWVVATHAGYVISKKNFDRDGVDVTIEASGEARPKLDVQLKASINLTANSDGVIKFPCPKKNYDKLRIATQTPRILIVMKLPTDKGDWISLSEEELTVRHAAYWISLKGLSETDNTTSVTIDIPAANKVTVQSLRDLMELSRKGAL